MSLADTIFALSSGAPPTGVALVRVSGSRTQQALEALIGDVPAPRKAVLRDIRSVSGDLIDRALVLYFPGPGSFTGEDCTEFHVHGGRAVIDALLKELGRLQGFRLAEAGEFTRRAFHAGKLDLTETEALADLVQAETQAQLRLALAGATGAQRALYEDWSQLVLRLRAAIEARLDFSDQDDVPEPLEEAELGSLERLKDEIGRHLAGARAAEIVRDGLHVVIAGAPNVGKSSLLNHLAGRDVAIVSEVAGTTRDVIEVALDLDGLKIVLFDTAGLRDSPDEIEQIGVARAKKRIDEADLVLALSDSEEVAQVETTAPVLHVRSKGDLSPTNDRLAISTLTGEGISELLDLISAHGAQLRSAVEAGAPLRRRQAALLGDIHRHIIAASSFLDFDMVLAAEELRLAQLCFDRLAGRHDVEDLLGVIFGSFCIGK